ncbi:MAG: ABC transporter permease subunit [Candidatus Delongbacteria bacterium]
MLADRTAAFLIAGGGISVVLAILLIFIFVGREALPLARGSHLGSAVTLPAAENLALLAGTDPFQDLAWSLDSLGGLHLADRVRATATRLSFPLDSLEHLSATALEGGVRADRFALGTSAGRLLLARVRVSRVLDEGAPHSTAELESVVPTLPVDSLADAASAGLPVELLAFGRGDNYSLLAWTAGGRLQLALEDRESESWTRLAPPTELAGLQVATLAVAPTGEGLALADAAGELIVLAAAPEGASVVERRATGLAGRVTSLAFLIGGNRLVAGDERGGLASLVEVQGEDGVHWISGEPLESHGAPITRLLPGPRDRSLLSVDAAGHGILHYVTTGRTLLEEELGATTASFGPRGDALVLAGPGLLKAVELANPHPEVSWRALFGRLQYESYEGRQSVWQSTGGGDDFEPKFSLLPLIFGTLKGTFFALLISVPLALLGAIYISQFAPTWLARTIKPAIEIMAALPSVIIGFLAGLVFAPYLEQHFTALLAFVVLLPLLILAMVPVWARIPGHKLGPKGLPQLAQGLVLSLLALGLAYGLAPWLDATVFGGSLIVWLQEKAGVVYDQRNSLVVGFALGFAVIPIIFTMAEDALSNVPDALVSASLALGASRWTTVARVVLPGAAAGVFAAIMIGLGRAIGETMIVLMATGNTPVMDISPLNGFRAMSACIAVEIPEAPLGSTLYRLLFLTALLLFLFTFAINSAASWIGERLRKSHGRIS